jgi:ATP-dependent helicase/nuclease subunit A
MTIYKAKGLEFDHVVLPYLDRTTRPTDPPLLLWRREGGGLLMAERRSGELYRWLAREDRARDAHERERLLYVACTRARESLHLFAEAEERPAGDSLLSLLWPQYAEAAIDAQTRHLAEAPAAPYRPAARESAASPPAARLRLPADHVWCPPAMDYPPPPVGPAAVERDALAHRPEVGLGTLIHEVLHHLSRVPLPDDALAFCRARQHVWREALQRFGVPDAAHDALLARLTDQLRGVLADPDGRRILQARTGAYAELALSSAGEVGVTRAFVDRTYVDPDGRRWIVDYKTGAPMPGETEQVFVAAEMQRHGPQLQRYAALARAVFAEPLRLALYFTALPRLEVFD